MKILHVISTLDPMAGGPVNAIEGLTAAQAQSGAEIEILATFRQGEDPSVADRLKQRDITLTHIGPTRSAIGYHARLKTAAHQAVARNDIVHIHALWEDVQHRAARAAQHLNKPYIIRPCGMLDPWSLSQSKLRKRIYLALRLRKNLNRAAALHFTAEAEHKLTEPLNLKAPAIIRPNGLDFSEFETLPPRGTFRKAHPKLGERPYVLFLSRIHPKKGLDLLIPAFAQAAPKEYALVVAGPGEPDYVQSILKLAQHHDIENRMLMPGMLTGKEKLAAYAESTLFALPSYQENFGIVIIEALACGAPVLISDKVNIYHEIVREDVGLSCTTDITSVSSAINSCLRDGTLINQSPEKQIRFATNRYDWRSIGNAWIDTYRELCSKTTLG